jgi:hypothetical protein
MISSGLDTPGELGKQKARPGNRQTPSAGCPAFILPRIEVLCCARSTAYQAMPFTLIRRKTNSAWLTNGTCPVIAHPPCRFWSRSRSRALGTLSERIEEMLTGLLCVREVLRRGGILEQPAHSRLFYVATLPIPAAAGQANDSWSMQVDQYHFGHRCSKPTWLWFCRIPQAQLPSPPLRLRANPIRKLDAITHGQRSSTPPDFAQWLCQCVLATQP